MRDAPIVIPAHLAASCRKTPERMAWLHALPTSIATLSRRWDLMLEAPISSEDVNCSWVAFAKRGDGSHAVLKLGMPHLEAMDEIAGLREWNGDGIVRLIDADTSVNAMLLERCEPGLSLRGVAEAEQDVVVSGLLKRLWATTPGRAFRPLSTMIEHWVDECRHHISNWPDAELVQSGLDTFAELIRTTSTRVLLATDLHAGNVLRAQREPWLAIDPKPFVGDPAYDATQHLLNCRDRLRRDPAGTIGRFAELLEVDAERVKRWAFARVAAEPRDDWNDTDLLDLARRLRG